MTCIIGLVHVLRALKITETFSSGVVGPFYVEVL